MGIDAILAHCRCGVEAGQIFLSTFSGEKDTESRMQGVWGWGKMGTEQGGLFHDV